MTDEELTKATKDYLKTNPDSSRESEGTQSMKRKINDQEVKDGKTQKTETIEEHQTEDGQRIPKRELDEEEDGNTNVDKRIRLETDHDTTNRERISLETISRDLNISSLQKKQQKQTRNRSYDVKAVAQGQVSRLLRLTSVLPDVDKFHDDEKLENISTQIAWDDLTGMQLDAGKVKEAREKEMQYVKDKGVWTKIPR